MRGLVSPFNAPIYRRGYGASTMRWAWKLAPSVPHGTAVVLKYQSKGRGQGSRRWYAPWGRSLLVSVILKEPGYAKVPALSLRCGLAIVAMLAQWGITTHIKWPNDILWNNLKLAGILTQVQENVYGTTAVVGIGINCTERRFPAQLRAASLYQVCAEMPRYPESVPTSPRGLLPQVLCSLHHYIPLPLWQEEVTCHLWKINQHVHICPTAGRPTHTGQGRIRGIAEDGSLLIEDGGVTTRYYSGEITLHS